MYTYFGISAGNKRWSKVSKNSKQFALQFVVGKAKLGSVCSYKELMYLL